jgi:hypothetical protein
MVSSNTTCPVGRLDSLGHEHGQINYMDTKAKCSHLKNWPVKGLCDKCLSVGGAPPLLCFCLGWSSNFVRSEPGPAEYGLHQDSTPSHPLPATHCLSILYFDTGKGGGVWTREKVRRATVHKAGSKIPNQHDWLYFQSINSDKHMPQSPFTGKNFVGDYILLRCLYS